MKFHTLYWLFLLVPLACEKEKEPVEIFLPGSQQYGSAQAMKSASESSSGEWTASAAGYWDSIYCCDKKLAVQVITYNEWNYTREALIFNFIPLKLGKHQVFKENDQLGLPYANYTRLVSDGDVFGAYYQLDKSSILFGNWIELTEINLTNQTVKGKFHVRFRVGDSYIQNGFPELVLFDDGQFEIQIVN